MPKKPPLAELPIGKLSAFFENLQKSRTREERSTVAKGFFDKVVGAYAFDKAGTGGSSVHALLRVVFPERDKARVFRLKEQALAKSITAALGLPGLPAATVASACPLADVVSKAVEERLPSAATFMLTLGTLNEQLDDLARGGKAAQTTVLLNLFSHSRPTRADAYFLTCVLLKFPWGGETALKLLLNALQPGAYCPSLTFERMCASVLDPASAELSGSFGVYAPTAQPTRATTPLHVWDKLAGSPGFRGDVLIETKVDGWRLQVHVRADGALHVFTHSGLARSTQLKEHAAYFARVGAQLRAALAHNGGARGSVLDCEVVVVTDGVVEPFGTVNGLRGATAAEVAGRRHHRLVLLDLLVDDGEVLLATPLRERRARLVARVPAPNDWIQLTDGVEASWQSSGHGFLGQPLPDAPRECPIRSAMARATALAREGIVVKSLDSPYTPGEGAGWVKYKRCATGALADELHLVVVGLCYGSGKNSRTLSRWVLAARDADGAGAPRYRRICETGCGLSRHKIRRLEAHFKAHATLAARARPRPPLPAWCAGKQWERHRPHLLLCDAAHGVVADVVVSELHPERGKSGRLGFSLRFPRIVRVREERDVSAAHSVEGMRELFLASRCFVETRPQPPPGAPPQPGSDSDSDGGESGDSDEPDDDDDDDDDEQQQRSDADADEEEEEEEEAAAPDGRAWPAAPAAQDARETVEQRVARILPLLRESDAAYARTHGKPTYGAQPDSPTSSAPPSRECTPQAKRTWAEAASSDVGGAAAPPRRLSDYEIGLALADSEPVRNRRWSECVFWLDTYSICERARALLAPRIRALGACVLERLDEESRWRATHVVVDRRQTQPKRTHLIRKLVLAVRAGQRHPLWTFFDEQLFSEEALALAAADADAPAATGEWERRCDAALRWTSTCPALASLDASCFE